MRTFWLGVEKVEQIRNKLSPVLLYLENKSMKLPGGGSTLCYKDRPKHAVMIDYLKQFLTAYKNKRKFFFSFVAELCHEYPNFLSYGDEDILEFFKWLKSGGVLENAVLVFFSDHGSRIDQIRNTFVGRIEDRMPMMHVVVPDHIRTKHPSAVENLQLNLDRLTTPFDMHQTLVDVLNDNFEKPSTSFIGDSLRSLSLFQPVSTERSCLDAWVPENYCACYTSTPVNVSEGTLAQDLATVMIDGLNRKFENEPRCVKLTLNKITDVRLVTNGLQHASTENTGISFLQFFRPEEVTKLRYDITIETLPGRGAFEATYHVTSGSQILLLGDIVRINKYGNQSICITDKLLRPYCFCQDQIQN